MLVKVHCANIKVVSNWKADLNSARNALILTIQNQFSGPSEAEACFHIHEAIDSLIVQASSHGATFAINLREIHFSLVQLLSELGFLIPEQDVMRLAVPEQDDFKIETIEGALNLYSYLKDVLEQDSDELIIQYTDGPGFKEFQRRAKRSEGRIWSKIKKLKKTVGVQG